MSNTTIRLAKGAVGLIVVVILLIVVFNWWGDYKSESSRLESPSATGTVDASGAASGSASAASQATTIGVVLIEGLNFRKAPDSASDTMRGLKKGERLIIVGTKDDWYSVKDSKGVSGWVTSKPQYVKIEK